MTIKNRTILLSLLLVFLGLSVGLSALFYVKTEKYALHEAQKQGKDVLYAHRAVQTYITTIQRPELYTLQANGMLNAEYFSPSIFSSTYIARNIIFLLNEERRKNGLPEIYFKLASDNPRNPINQADPVERDLLKRINSEGLRDYSKLVDRPDGKWLYMAVPVQPTNSGCLKCHGDPANAPKDLLRIYGNKAGFYEKAGEYRALVSIRVPLAPVLIESFNLFIMLTGITITCLALIYLIIFQFIRNLDSKQQSLNQTTQRLELALKSGRFGIWDWDIQKDSLVWDDRMFELYGVNRASFKGCVEAWENGLHPQDRSCALAAIKATLGGEKEYDISFRILHPDGTIKFIKAEGLVIRDTNGNPLRMIGLNSDISEQQALFENIVKERNKAKLYLDIAGVMIAAINESGEIILINQKGCEILGYEDVELLGRNWFDVCLPQSVVSIVKEVFAKQMAGDIETVEFFENPIINSEGNERMIAFHNSLLRDDSGDIQGVLFSGEDITEHKNLENQLRQSQKLEAVGHLAGGIAHDFNNLLTVIGGYASLLQMKMPPDDPNKEKVDHILQATERATNLTRSLLAFSRKQEMLPQYVNLNEIIQSVGKFLIRIIGEDITLTTTLRNDPITVYADKGQIEQVLINLATNARDAMDSNGTLAIETQLVEIDDLFMQAHGYGTPGNFALIILSDDGKGMDEVTKGKIFEPFFTTKDVGKGTGLGLAIVYGIINQHNGYIDVFSEPGKGTVFKIYLPLSQKQLSTQEERRSLESPAIGSETILVVEDEALVRQLVEATLIQFGYNVILAENGQDGIDKFLANRDKVSLIITDLKMPKKSGKELFDEVRAIQPGMKVLFMSGYTADMLKNKGDIEEQFELLMKPIVPLELAKKIREMLDASSN